MAAITGTLRAHGGPVRRVSLPWHGDCHHFPELDCVLIQSSPGLNNLQEFDLHYVPRIEYYSQLLPVPHSVASVLSFSSTLRVLRIRSSSSKEKFLQFPMRSACTLSSHAPIEQLRLSHETRVLAVVSILALRPLGALVCQLVGNRDTKSSKKSLLPMFHN
nr:unnamed protein product [Digitaria exilis]